MRIAVPALAALLLAVAPAEAAPCRIGVDLGSSGIRAEWEGHSGTARAEIGYLREVWATGAIRVSADQTVTAMEEARRTLGTPEGCPALGGGYSAWRLAAEGKDGPGALAPVLDGLRRRAGLAVLVIPQEREGAHAFHAASLALGARLRTGAILDVGGGSLQVAAPQRGRGVALGQKSWLKLFCERVKGLADPACSANPVGEAGEAAAARLLAAELAGMAEAFRPLPVFTAVSAPVARGIHPVLRHLAASLPGFAGRVEAEGFDRAALASAVALLRDGDDRTIAARLEGCGAACSPRFVGTLVTDMLLLAGVMDAVGAQRLEVAEADINNAAGLLADRRAGEWATRHQCYVARFATQGVAAFDTDPATCPAL
jgi:hypothetical protein